MTVEEEIEAFKTEEYWSIEADFEINNIKVPAVLEILSGEKLEKFSIKNEIEAKNALSLLQNKIGRAHV